MAMEEETFYAHCNQFYMFVVRHIPGINMSNISNFCSRLQILYWFVIPDISDCSLKSSQIHVF